MFTLLTPPPSQELLVTSYTEESSIQTERFVLDYFAKADLRVVSRSHTTANPEFADVPPITSPGIFHKHSSYMFLCAVQASRK